MTITYLCPALDHPVGGVKVIYRHAEMLSQQGIECYIHHPQDPQFRCTWFQHQAKFRLTSNFDAAHDFVVIPEVWAAYLGAQCRDLGIRFAIFVQNGYLIQSGKAQATDAELMRVYQSADMILSISEDTSAMIGLAFPRVPKENIVRLLPSISEKFQIGEKQKVISFMPRKLKPHVDLASFFLQEYLPADWRLSAIDKKSEDEVARLLGESSIFLSFSDLEGLPLPPLEAAFSGNVVVGYAGRGAREYFHRPLFHEAEYGDFQKIITVVQRLIQEIEDGRLTPSNLLDAIGTLSARYSKENELAYLLNFARRAQNLLSEKNVVRKRRNPQLGEPPILGQAPDSVF